MSPNNIIFMFALQQESNSWLLDVKNHSEKMLEKAYEKIIAE